MLCHRAEQALRTSDREEREGDQNRRPVDLLGELEVVESTFDRDLQAAPTSRLRPSLRADDIVVELRHCRSVRSNIAYGATLLTQAFGRVCAVSEQGCTNVGHTGAQCGDTDPNFQSS